ncbi:DEAD/DEAH box helicase family protein [bacterium]|nr:DEAD/DEAH box helicase family protein [bacterium]
MAIIDDLEFKGNWRSYQQRVLDELEIHLDDKKLNVVAAPGAGKTTLGIEVMARLGNNALILAPTITIRNQWKQRILEGFLPDGYDKTKISTDIRNITDITVSTYQALHTIYKIPEEKEKFLSTLNKNKVKTLVLDESHHLRTEWYLTLDKLCEYLESSDFTTVSLTGTPPYDVSPEEWNNYHSLCGPVDAEISIPELVKNGDLCPHQDLIYFSDLSSEEEKTVYDFEKNRSEFFRYIERQSDFQHAVEMSEFVQQHNPDVIFKNTGFTLSVISYLLSADSLSIPARVMTEFLELELNMIPSFDLDIAKTLVDGILGAFEPYFENSHVIKNKLKELKLLNGNKADLKGEVDFKKLFARSVNKLNAIKDITTHEYSTLKKNLREVVLLDYIGKGDNIGLNIFSVFDKLVDKKISLGILTGTLIVIPETAKEELYKILERRKIASDKVLTTTYKDGYMRVETYGETNIVSVITELFEKGKMNVLIGTAALLGEGWDSPSVNTLIIASVVGSFMLSNQMRGRALRVDKSNPEKSSNIWHLVSLTSYEGVESPDFQTVIKRFNTFEGISYKDNQIQNGISRLGKTFKEFESTDCKKLNEKMFEYAKIRFNLKNKWEQVFKKSKINEKNMTSQMYEIIETDTHLPQVIENEGFMRKFMSDYRNRQKVEYSKFEQMKLADCILKTLCDIDVIKTPFEDMTIQTDKNENGKFSLTLVGGTSNERNIFVKSFCEVFAFDESTRYILKITRKKKEKVKEKKIVTDMNFNNYTTYTEKTVEKDVVKYLPVPNVIGTHQNYVKIFTKNLKGERVEKEKKTFLTEKKSCLQPANIMTEVKIQHNNSKQKSFYLSEFADLLKHNIESLNISDKVKNEVDIQAYKKGTKTLITFFNCSDYERNLIVNNLCEMYSKYHNQKMLLKVKEKDGLVYFDVSNKLIVNQNYWSHFEHYFRHGNQKKEISNKKLKKHNEICENIGLGLLYAFIGSCIICPICNAIFGYGLGLINVMILGWLPFCMGGLLLAWVAGCWIAEVIRDNLYDTSPNKISLSSKVVTGLLSIVSSVFILNALDFIYYDFTFIILLLVPFFAVFAFTIIPVDFALTSIAKINKGNFTYKLKDYSDNHELSELGISDAWGLDAFFIIIFVEVWKFYNIFIMLFINLFVVMPYRAICRNIYQRKQNNNKQVSSLQKKRLLQIFIAKKSAPLMEREIVININVFNNLAKKLKNLFDDIMTKIEYHKFNKENDLSKDATIDMLYTKSAKNRGEVLKARYNAWLNADISRSRKWI